MIINLILWYIPMSELRNLSTPVVFRGTILRIVEPSGSRLKWQVDVKTLSQPHPPQPPQQEQSQPVKPPPTKPPLQPQSTTRPTLPISLRDGKGGRGQQSVHVEKLTDLTDLEACLPRLVHAQLRTRMERTRVPKRNYFETNLVSGGEF